MAGHQVGTVPISFIGSYENNHIFVKCREHDFRLFKHLLSFKYPISGCDYQALYCGLYDHSTTKVNGQLSLNQFPTHTSRLAICILWYYSAEAEESLL
jgi:hypothetical protein